jgi:hypothetical protein
LSLGQALRLRVPMALNGKSIEGIPRTMVYLLAASAASSGIEDLFWVSSHFMKPFWQL